MNSINSTDMMALFCRSFIGSVLTFCSISWFGNLNMFNQNRLNSCTKTESKISGSNKPNLSEIYSSQAQRKAYAILGCLNHLLQSEFEL